MSKRPSGAQFRAEKKKQKKEDESLRGSIQKLFAAQSVATSSSNSNDEPLLSNEEDDFPIEATSIETDHELETILHQNTDSPSQTQHAAEAEEIEARASHSVLCNSIQVHDPHSWPQILSDGIRDFIIDSGPPKQVLNVNTFPQTDGRSFSQKLFFVRLPNGEKLHRTWLIYSESSDSCYCFCCALFDRDSNKFSKAGVGYRSWKNIHRDLTEHGHNQKHALAFSTWKQYEKRLQTASTIDYHHKKMIEKETEHLKQVFVRVVHGVKYLASQSLAFRGGSDRLYVENNGNFLQLMETIAKFDPVMSEHLRRFTNHESNQHFLSHRIQNELLGMISSAVTEQIISMIHDSIYFGIIVDCTPDLSHKEQMSIIIRFVHHAADNRRFRICEKFLAFSEVSDKTGKGISKAILDQLSKYNLEIRNIRGQGYDNGSNMKGKNIGVQKQILDKNSRAFFGPCACHSLNLVINDAASSSSEITAFFAIVQQLYVFFSDSTVRWDILQKHAADSKAIVLKNLSTTRWSSRVSALKCLHSNLPQIYDALLDVYETTTDNKAKNVANGLAEKISNFKFICSVIIWYNLLNSVNIVSKLLQAKTIDICKCLEQINHLKSYFANLRQNDPAIEVFMDSAVSIAGDMNVTANFEETARFRMRHRTARGAEGPDEPVEDPKTRFKIDFVFYLLDVVINSLDERFEQLTSISLNFKVLFNINDENITLDDCKAVETALTGRENDEIEKDIDGTDLYNEIKLLQHLYTPILKTDKSPLGILNYLAENMLLELFPNLVIAFRILITLPIGVASAESSFSKLKIIKSYLRTTMSQERLTDLAIISIEKDHLSDELINGVVNKFAELRARAK